MIPRRDQEGDECKRERVISFMQQARKDVVNGCPNRDRDLLRIALGADEHMSRPIFRHMLLAYCGNHRTADTSELQHTVPRQILIRLCYSCTARPRIAEASIEQRGC